jgi:ABC-type dipeptide/oligopeptide/nickel transport system ATPase subunit
MHPTCGANRHLSNGWWQVIGELDEKKAQALHLTWEKVNKDFGSIFSTLLPGTMAKLEPPEGGSVLDGLEVRVAFGTVWKESLTELSGGQRSLLALSLILALLLFKPAPIYILDEVDAALDLSHTQNIGYVPLSLSLSLPHTHTPTHRACPFDRAMRPVEHAPPDQTSSRQQRPQHD